MQEAIKAYTWQAMKLCNTVQSTSRDLEYYLNVTSAQPHKVTQKELSDLITDLEISKHKAELVSSRLQQWNLLDDTVKVTAFRSHQKDFEQFFITQGELSACKNIEGLMAAMKIIYNLKEWQLFIDSSMHSLKLVLLHKGNILPSIPVAYAVHKKETYENMKEILSCMNYTT
jgi:hypothetical protein